jgi:hypothetical protein
MNAVAVDPVYQYPLPEQERIAFNDMHEVKQQMQQAAGTMTRKDADWDDWTDKHTATLDEFLLDQREHPSNYIAASLPNLPFEDESFDIVVSSHLLFAYAPLKDGGVARARPHPSNDDPNMDLKWHYQALDELLRVSRGDVRIFDANNYDSDLLANAEAKLHPFVPQLIPLLPPQWAAKLYKPPVPVRT